MKSSCAGTVFLAITFAVFAEVPPEDSRREELSSGTGEDETCEHPEQCGPNSECRSLLGLPMCRCLPDFVGSPPSCSRRCLDDADCPEGQACLGAEPERPELPRSCASPCARSCGLRAECLVVARRAQCACPKGWFGDPRAICRECNSHADCPADRPACIFEISCENQCEGLCGAHAHCSISTNNATGRSTPACSCPEGRTGNPFDYCRPIDRGNPCEPSPCGANTECRPTRDFARARCGCLPGYLGEPRSGRGCELGQDCLADADCAADRACLDSLCQDPCVELGLECPGPRFACLVLDHKPVCRRSGDCQRASNATSGASACGEGPELDAVPVPRREPRPRAIADPAAGNDSLELTA